MRMTGVRRGAKGSPSTISAMKLVKHLANLGYGTRREVEWLLSRDGCATPTALLVPAEHRAHEDVRVDDLRSTRARRSCFC